MSIMLEKLTSQDFAPYLNEDFSIDFDAAEPLVAKLISVSEVGSPQPRAKRRAFSLIFLGPLEPLLGQRIYRVTHPKIGALEIFLVPIGHGQGGIEYEAIFN